ncbi:glycosyltransferase family 2 protein [Herbiconiux sp. CPCC 205716]|uniref:Glycosyltransferase family 2 protein n=1 Tax=Herbiconiux gentiana TaxID=2970912 RepID=A0ABT2GAX5_9MICO|nr:glycosyltransferase family 2 protein [Herbiconiux gentiana]MCS5713343.1 glycosyltransferase family 2 protein [Herbiconiux gentiana]
MTTFLITLLLVFGLSTLIWTSAGLIRLVAARLAPRPGSALRGSAPRASAPRASAPRGSAPRASALAGGRPERDRVAVLMAAHDEEPVIGATLAALQELEAGVQLFLVSDGSTDATARIAREHGASVLELTPNRGKAGALVEAIRHFELAERFDVVMLLDADTRLAPDYFETGLRAFDDPGVVAVAGRATTLLTPRSPTVTGRVLVAYRERVYVAMQYLFKFGQAGRFANAVPIVPGFASMYRTRILADIDIAAPGLKIEDYNMTFEVHAKRLGRIAFHPHSAIAHTQDPDELVDYVKQVERWNLGFWQTVLRHRFRFSTFWLALSLFIVELLVSSVVLVLVLPAVAVSTSLALAGELGLPAGAPLDAVPDALPPLALVLGVIVPDYLLTLLAAVVSRRVSYLVYGLVFPVLRVVDALLCLVALYKAGSRRSTGQWTSPSRRPLSPTPG